MGETNQFKLPLIEAAQAQKHVTVNEALVRLDAAAQLRLVSVSETVPPVSAEDGIAYGVPSGAVNDWDGHIGEVAVYSNNGWIFMTPSVGWAAWIEDAHHRAIFDGASWHAHLTTLSANGANTAFHTLEFDHVITAGVDNDTAVEIEDSMLVYGVTGRVLSEITGSGITGWKLGVDGATARFGDDLSLSFNSWIRGLSSRPLAYWGGVPLKLTSLDGDFTGGSIRFVIHGLRLEPPNAV